MFRPESGLAGFGPRPVTPYSGQGIPMRQDLSQAGPRRASERKLVLVIALAVSVALARRIEAMNHSGLRIGTGREGRCAASRQVVFSGTSTTARRATPAENLKLADGFRAELVYTVAGGARLLGLPDGRPPGPPHRLGTVG